MPIISISTIQTSLLGLCFMKGTQRDNLKKEWDDRIDARAALWVELDVDSSYETIQESILSAIQQQQGALPNKEYILAAFLDFQEQIPADLLESLNKIQQLLGLVLNRRTIAVMQFGYVGTIGLSRGKMARENAAMFANANASRPAALLHRLCLVGTEFTKIGEESNWRAVMLFLDLIRRQNSLVDFLPTGPDGVPNDDVAYLRYSEYDKKKTAALELEKERITLLKGTQGDQELFTLYEERRSEMRRIVKDRFAIARNVHPIHPGMNVTGFLKIRSAQHGNNAAYNDAAEKTKTAVYQTAQRMEQEIKQIFAGYIQNAQQDLANMLEKAKVGLQLKKDAAHMRNILNLTQGSDRPMLPMLFYNPAGPSEEIYEYLIKVRNYVTDACVAEYENKIRAAYEALVEKGFEEEEQLLDAELTAVQEKLRHLQIPQTIVETIRNNGFLPETGLIPNGVSGKQKGYVIFRGDVDTTNLMNTIAGSMAVYKMNALADDPESVKNIPVKAVQMTVCDNSDQVLKDLINWDF